MNLQKAEMPCVARGIKLFQKDETKTIKPKNH